MYLFVGKGMRGGLFYIPERCSKTNNKYRKLHDDSKPSKYITYMDAKKSLWFGNSQYLPYSGFKWQNQNKIGGFHVNLVSENNFHESISEVDLEYLDILQFT